GSSRYTQGAVNAVTRRRVASTHPRPKIRRGSELPQVVERSSKIALSAKEPEIASFVSPTEGLRATSGDVSGSGYARRPIYAIRRRRAASAYPCPLLGRGLKLP